MESTKRYYIISCRAVSIHLRQSTTNPTRACSVGTQKRNFFIYQQPIRRHSRPFFTVTAKRRDQKSITSAITMWHPRNLDKPAAKAGGSTTATKGNAQHGTHFNDFRAPPHRFAARISRSLGAAARETRNDRSCAQRRDRLPRDND